MENSFLRRRSWYKSVVPTIPELEKKHLDAAHDQVIARQMLDQALAAARDAGVDPDTDVVVRRLREQL